MLNPELNRNIWLSFSKPRLIVPLFLLVSAFIILFFIQEETTKTLEIMQNGSSILFVVISILWGTKQVAQSISSEVNNKTWDNQKLTLITPWQMTVGKLFGSSIFSWYCGLLCMLFYLLSSLMVSNSVERLKFGLVMVLLAIFIHGFSLSQVLLAVLKYTNTEKKKIGEYFHIIIGIIIALFLINKFQTILDVNSRKITWYSTQFNFSDFTLLSLLFFSMWAIIGVYRNMRSEFRLNNLPWIWILFIISMGFYFSGFLNILGQMNLSTAFFLSLYNFLVISLFLSYYTLYYEPYRTTGIIKELKVAYKSKRYKMVLTDTPKWIVSLWLSVMFCLVIVIFQALNDQISLSDCIYKKEFHFLTSINLICFTSRDLIVLSYFKKKSQFAGTLISFWLISLYLVLPAIMAATRLSGFLPVFIPSFESGFLIGTLPILIQLLLLILFVFYKTNKPSQLEENEKR